jgi:two-component system cell cycle sensor histidine kinase/response regulator CckA
MKSDVVFALENAGWPALLVDSESTVCRANAPAVKLFGAALEGASPQLSAIWAADNPAAADCFLSHWERAPAPTVTLRLRGKGGSVQGYLTSICAFNKDGQKYFVLQLLPQASSPAVDPRPETPESAAAQKQKLECALQLARTVALDFNNALTSILGHTSLLLTKVESDHAWRGSLLEIEKAAAKGAEIANDLGNFSRREKDPGSQTAGNLNQLIQRSVESFERDPRAELVQWTILLERKLFAVKFDEAKMQQALIKLVENALEALNGSGRVTVQTRNVELGEKAQDRNVQLAAGAYVCIEISDTGCGIAPEVLSRVFEPFFTTKKGPHRGLGLAWVYGIVSNHGGGVAISSQPGAGASVRLYLPAETRIVKDDGTANEDLRGSQTVLLVDDEDPVLMIGQMILSAYGYRVLTANSGQKALALLAADEPVDLVITDLVMPSMSGRELVEHIHRRDPSTRVLCTSGYIWPGGRTNGEAYLQKPFTAQELLRKVKRMLSS